MFSFILLLISCVTLIKRVECRARDDTGIVWTRTIYCLIWSGPEGSISMQPNWTKVECDEYALVGLIAWKSTWMVPAEKPIVVQ